MPTNTTQTSASAPATVPARPRSMRAPETAHDVETRARLESMRGTPGSRAAAQHRLAVRLGLKHNGSFFYPSEDRTILECLIIPFYQLSAAHQHLLFIGTDWYTQGYNRMFRTKDYATLDADPDKAQYGADHHIQAGADTLSEHVAPGTLDLIVCNGVVGWGLDEVAAAEKAFQGCFDALRPGGHLIVGWNDLVERRPFDMFKLKSLARFEPLKFPPLGVTQHLVENEWRHTYTFFAKPLLSA